VARKTLFLTADARRPAPINDHQGGWLENGVNRRFPGSPSVDQALARLAGQVLAVIRSWAAKFLKLEYFQKSASGPTKKGSLRGRTAFLGMPEMPFLQNSYLCPSDLLFFEGAA
jgi:hypothetical protein